MLWTGALMDKEWQVVEKIKSLNCKFCHRKLNLQLYPAKNLMLFLLYLESFRD